MRPIRWFRLAIVFASALPAAALGSPDISPRDPTPQEVESFREKSHLRLDREESDRVRGTAVELFLFERTAEPPESLPASLAREFALPLDAARHLAVGALILGANWAERDQPLELAGAHLTRAVAIAPSSWPAVEELAHFHASGGRCDSQELIQIARNWGDLRDAALRLDEFVTRWSGCDAPLMTALAEHPHDLKLLALLARGYSDEQRPFGIAVRKYVYDEFVREPRRDVPEPVRIQIARSYLATLLAVGAAEAGVAEYEALPAALQRSVWQHVSNPDFPEGYRGIATSDRAAFQIELAAAYQRSGNEKRARKLLRAIAADEPPTSQEKSSRSDPRECIAVLRASLGEGVADPFALLIDAGGLETGGHWGDGGGCAHNATWTALISRYAARAGYPEIEQHLAGKGSRALERGFFDADQDRDALRTAPTGLQNAMAYVGRELVQSEGSTPRESAPPDAEPVSPVVLDAIARYPATPFVEHPLPDAIAPVGEVAREVEATIEGADFGNPTSPYTAWREQRIGDTMLRIELNQDYDPVGEVSAGGYWLHVSRDAGGSWQDPIYTGLRDRLPYVVRRDSRLPMLSGDTLQLEVAIDEIEPESISFPPLGLSSKRRAEGRFVSASLADLARDSDGDGLTDLAENALLCDPANPDTDGDSIRDGNDGLPHVARGTGDPERAAALLAALQLMFGPALSAHVIPIDTGASDEESQMRRAIGVPARLGAEPALFVVGRRSDFAALDTARPVIVLTAREAAAVRESRAVFYPARISLFVLDREHKRGLIIWNASWRGGTMRLDRDEKGAWKATATQDWIT